MTDASTPLKNQEGQEEIRRPTRPAPPPPGQEQEGQVEIQRPTRPAPPPPTKEEEKGSQTLRRSESAPGLGETTTTPAGNIKEILVRSNSFSGRKSPVHSRNADSMSPDSTPNKGKAVDHHAKSKWNSRR